MDSSVVAMLLNKAIGDQLTCVFVDNGLLRLNEGDEVMKTFSQITLVSRLLELMLKNIFIASTLRCK